MFFQLRILNLLLTVTCEFSKMNSPLILPIHSFTLSIFIILLMLSTSNGDDRRYKTCSSSKVSCGNVNVGYPFWGPGRPQYCGHPALQIQCPKNQSDEYPVLIIGKSEVCYHVINIFSSSVNMTLQLLEFPKTCPPFHSFKTVFDEVFVFKSGVINITLLHDCPGQHMDGVPRSSIKCWDNHTTTYYLNSTLHPQLHKGCKAIEVPVLKDEFDHINQSTLDGVLYQGFMIEYRNDPACSSCQKSGGTCGSQDDAEFACYHGIRFSKWKVIVGIAIPAGFLSLIALNVGFWWCMKRKSYINSKVSFLWKAQARKYKNIDAFLRIYGTLTPKRYTYAMIRSMTNSFNERLGEGGYAIVYKGKLCNGRLVAVKLLKQSKGTGEDFINEVASICRTNHVNIVALLGFCFEGKRRALIYDFMSNGSLEKFAYHGAREQALPWETLHSIAVGIARGLDYLHRGCNARILHFDIKPHNILLDEDFCPKISDFGLARLCPQQESTISMLDARGTIGYIAPEVFCRTIGGVSHKSDVYSYGMMILDIVCGRKNLISAETQRSSELYFPHWIYKRVQQGEEVAVHGTMNEEEKAIERKMILVSLWCIQTYPSNRPSMSRVIEMLQGGLELIQLPPAPQLSSPPRMDHSFVETMSLAQ